MTLTLAPGRASLADLAQLYWTGAAVSLDRAARPGVEAAVAHVSAAAGGSEPVYGVNTGFGKLAQVRIPAADTATLQRNLILSHCAGVGPALAPRIARLVIALKLLSLGRGASGVRWAIVLTWRMFATESAIPPIPVRSWPSSALAIVQPPPSGPTRFA